MSESGSSVPSYISSLPSPLRRRHKDDLLAADSTVVSSARRYDCAPPGWVLQRLGRGYCCCQHLLWQRHCHGWEKHLLHLLLSIHRSMSTELERSIRIGPVDFIASLGGLFGLCLGFSIISFLEIIYWATTGFFRNAFKKWSEFDKKFHVCTSLYKGSPLRNKSGTTAHVQMKSWPASFEIQTLNLMNSFNKGKRCSCLMIVKFLSIWANIEI